MTRRNTTALAVIVMLVATVLPASADWVTPTPTPTPAPTPTPSGVTYRSAADCRRASGEVKIFRVTSRISQDDARQKVRAACEDWKRTPPPAPTPTPTTPSGGSGSGSGSGVTYRSAADCRRASGEVKIFRVTSRISQDDARQKVRAACEDWKRTPPPAPTPTPTTPSGGSGSGSGSGFLSGPPGGYFVYQRPRSVGLHRLQVHPAA